MTELTEPTEIADYSDVDLPIPQPGQVSGLPPQEQWDDWRRRYGIHAPAVRRSEVPEILVRCVPEFNSLAAIRQALLDNQAKLDVQHAAMTGRNQAKLERYRAALRQSTIAAAPPPVKPELEQWAGLAHDVDLFLEYHGILEAVERGRLRERADELKEIVRRRSAPFSRAVREARQALADAEAAYQPYQAAMNVVDRAVSGGTGGTAAGTVRDVRGDDGRVLPPRRSEVQAQQKVLDDFNESRRDARDPFLRGRR